MVVLVYQDHKIEEISDVGKRAGTIFNGQAQGWESG